MSDTPEPPPQASDARESDARGSDSPEPDTPEKVSPWLRLWSIGLSMFLASAGTVGVFALFLHGDFLDDGVDGVADFLRPRPALQAFLACTPLLAAILLGFGASAKRRRRQKAEDLAEMRKAVGLD